MTSTLTDGDFKVADLSLAGFGRKEITLAEHEMPGLMALREDHPATLTTTGPQVVLCMAGRSVLTSPDGELELEKGCSAFVPAGATVSARGDAVLFRATTDLA